MPPPPAEPFAARVFLGPALRAQPDRRLVKLVREGYETAFEEIVRRYRRPLDRFAAAIVGGRSEDVTQDAFSKALLALRGTTTEIELKPWLYRIVRNTALNEIRDAPPPTEELGETIPGGRSAAVEAERREEIGELMERLRALPEPQRAAIVMRELEGLSHEEIAAALGVSGGAARQAIYRARLTLRDGLGMLIPLPLLRVLFDHSAEAAAGAGAGGTVAAAGAASAAGGGAGATLGGIGAAGALKVGLATAVLAGSVGAGVAIQHDRGGRGPDPAEAAATRLPAGEPSGSGGSPSGSGPGQAPLIVSGGDRARGGSGSRDDRGRGPGSDDHRGHGSGGTDDDFDGSSDRGGDPGSELGSGHDGHGSGHGGRSGPGGGSDEDSSGEGHSSRHGSGGSGGEGSGSGAHGGSGSSGGEGSHGGGSGSDGGGDRIGGSGDGGHGSDNSGSSGGPAPATIPPAAPELPPEDSGERSGGGSGSSGSGSGDGDLAPGEIDS
jgi:RNA polymerase sigma factor (sigma-70 family)